MDFHNLTRKELQTLCKKNKIPANITNVAMADALKALQFVEGVEEFLNPSESVTAQSSIESPEKPEVTSPCVPCTGVRTTRRKTVKHDLENSQTLTRARRSSRKVVETPVPNNSRRAPVASVRRKMDAQLEGVEEDKKFGNKDISETPGALPTGLRRGLMDEDMVGRSYGTRRSARLAEKNVGSTKEGRGKIEPVKSELFSEESGENLEIVEMNVKEPSDDLGEIIQTTDADLKGELEEDLRRNNDKETNSDKKSDHLNENQIQFGSKFDQESSGSFVGESEKKIEDDGAGEDGHNFDYKEIHSEICEETDPSADTFDESLGMHDEVREISGAVELFLYKADEAFESGNKMDVKEENGDKLDASDEMVSENVAAGIVEKELAQDDAFTAANKTLKISDKREDLSEDRDSGPSDKPPVNDKVFENIKNENDMGFQDCLGDDLKYSVDLASFDISDGALTKEDEFTTLDKTIKTSEEIMNLIEGDSLTVSVADQRLENAKRENGIGFQDGLADDLEANKYSEDLAPSGENEAGFYPSSGEKSVVVLPDDKDLGMDLVSALESMTFDDSHSSEEEYIDNLTVETTTLDLNASAEVLLSGLQPEKRAKICDVLDSEKSPTAQLWMLDTSNSRVSYNVLPVVPDIGEVSLCNFTDEPSKILSSSAETKLSDNVIPTSLTPSKKSASKTPMKKCASKTPATTKKLSHVFDDKENIDNSGTKLILTKEKTKNKDFGHYIDVSLRKLKKELKEKLESNKKTDEQVMSARPALQAVSENVADE